MYVKNLLFVALGAAMMLSCKKERNESVPPGNVKVTIDKFAVKEYDNVEVEASVTGLAEADIWQKGFTWSLGAQREISDSVISLLPSQQFNSHINGIGQNATLYFRAYVQTRFDTYYSDSILVNTSGLQLLWRNELDGPRRIIKELLPLGSHGFLLLIETQGNGVNSWPELVQLDTSGQLAWRRQYFAGEIKEPQRLLAVPDGYLVVTKDGYRGPSGVIVFKTDLFGNKLWEKKLARKAFQDIVRLLALPDQTVRVTTRGYDAVENNVRVNISIDDYILDAGGQVISETSQPNNSTFKLGTTDLLAINTPDGGFALTHGSEQVTINGGIISMQKFTNANQSGWQQTYPLTGVAHPSYLTTNTAGNFLLMGSVTNDLVAMEIDKNNGAKLWDYQFESWKLDEPSGSGSMQAVDDHYYIATDSKLKLDRYKNGPLLIKLDRNGKLVYEYMHYQLGQTLTFTRTDAMYVNANKEIYLFGTLLRSLSDTDMKLFVMKLKER